MLYDYYVIQHCSLFIFAFALSIQKDIDGMNNEPCPVCAQSLDREVNYDNCVIYTYQCTLF